MVTLYNCDLFFDTTEQYIYYNVLNASYSPWPIHAENLSALLKFDMNIEQLILWIFSF